MSFEILIAATYARGLANEKARNIFLRAFQSDELFT